MGGESITAADLEYDLPRQRIAQHPPARRDDARMLVVGRAGGDLRDARITDLPALLRRGDLVVVNDTKVLPAGFAARRETGGAVHGLYVAEGAPGRWTVLLRSSGRLRAGEVLGVVGRGVGDVTLELMEAGIDGQWTVRVNTAEPAARVLERIGHTPLPPYIRREGDAHESADRSRYQTVYAKVPGAIAAPTAGLHLTEGLLDSVRGRGVEIARVTLHVGIGTFKPIGVENIDEHAMHEERYEIGDEAAEAVAACRVRGGRVIGVGTTSVRALESAACDGVRRGCTRSGKGTTKLFIRPPYAFRVVDGLLTNFHLPRTTLLALVMAFAGVANTRRAYTHAIRSRYRFYSYGDAMLVL